MKKKLFSLLVILFTFGPSLSFAYPLFYKCDEQDSLSYDTLGEANKRDQGYTWDRLDSGEHRQLRRSLRQGLGY